MSTDGWESQGVSKKLSNENCAAAIGAEEKLSPGVKPSEARFKSRCNCLVRPPGVRLAFGHRPATGIPT